MLSNEQRAHDIAVALLPAVIREKELVLYHINSDLSEHFHGVEVVELYRWLYEQVLFELSAG